MRKVLDNDAKDVSRVLFRDTVEVMGVRCRLAAVIWYVDDSLDVGGGHYAAYVKRQGTWMLHDGMYTAEEEPDLGHPNNTTALYRREAQPTMDESPVLETQVGNIPEGPPEPPGEQMGPTADPEPRPEGQPPMDQPPSPTGARQNPAPSPQEPETLSCRARLVPDTRGPPAGEDPLSQFGGPHGSGPELADSPADAKQEDTARDVTENSPDAHAVDSKGHVRRSENSQPSGRGGGVHVSEKQTSTSPIEACVAIEHEPPTRATDQRPLATPNVDGAQGGSSPPWAAKTLEDGVEKVPSMSAVFSRISSSLNQLPRTGCEDYQTKSYKPPRPSACRTWCSATPCRVTCTALTHLPTPDPMCLP